MARTTTSDAHRRAVAKYDQEKTRKWTLKLVYATDQDIIDKLLAQETVQGYIKRLIREDIEREENHENVEK